MKHSTACDTTIQQAVGICVGTATIKTVTVERSANGHIAVTNQFVKAHAGNPQHIFEEVMKSLPGAPGLKVAVTGRKFRHSVNLSSIPEPKAIEQAFLHLSGGGNGVEAIVSAGSEAFILYLLGSDGRISSVHAGNKCASGTGEFFLQQIRRMDVGLEEAVRIARTAEPYKVSGRCSVFCKSDCTHATNKGIPKERVTSGLCQMMAGKILELIKKVSRSHVMVIGGCALNQVMIDHLKKDVPGIVIPEEAPYFEAFGCALWALANDTLPVPAASDLFKPRKHAFPHLPPLKNAEDMVTFKSAPRGTIKEGDRCVLGLDVGSTTTKAVLVRMSDQLILASDYLRTNGDPVGASRACYRSLAAQIGNLNGRIAIAGLGVTGSGRQIAGLHAMTDGVINEIIAHAAGAVYFDGDVDTIFEIGGQDAKYTHLTNGVPSDYAMNEACSAGTGSFLEEAAREALNIATEEIAGIAVRGTNPPNFNDQCAAFISSDIKNAFHEGLSMEDIVAGLVYSICMNYANRVKGSRKVGQKVFMQGGVCYNKAIPLAMATLIGKPIIVPPDPGLTGAFGVALEIIDRLNLGFIKEENYSLEVLRDRELEYGPSFVCNGGKENCDRRCEIARIRIDGKVYPFGGACNRWYNMRSNAKFDVGKLNRVASFERIVFPPAQEAEAKPAGAPVVGINKSFMVNTYYPLYRTFFEALGVKVVLAGRIDQEGIDKKSAPFCYPAEIAHGYFLDLLNQKPDYLFLPQLKGDFVDTGKHQGVTCPLSQGEPFYLAPAFKEHPTYRRLKAEGRILDPVLDFSKGLPESRDAFVATAARLGIGRSTAVAAFRKALDAQKKAADEIKAVGAEVLAELEADPDAFAVVIFGRSYNALVSEAHMGIPNKIASRGIRVVPLNALPLSGRIVKDHMYWSAGQRILQVSDFVKNHPQLFGCYVTNFSCGPDSFLVGYFRDVMGTKPSLTLELDSHVADAGLETRIEAFIDIVKRYRKLGLDKIPDQEDTFLPARIHASKDRAVYVDSHGKGYNLSDPNVHIIIPSMGRFIAEAGAAAFRGLGYRASALPPADDEVLKAGRGCSSCKECLPLIITAGSLLDYTKHRQKPEERLIYFMPTASGPCRYGQYTTFLADLIRHRKLEHVAMLSFTAENSYSGFGGQRLAMGIWGAVTMASIFEEIYSTLLTNAVDRAKAVEIFETQWRKAISAMETSPNLKNVSRALSEAAEVLAAIPVRRTLAETPVVLLAGEIFVRHDGISRQYLLEELAERGFAAKVSSVMEWIYYTDWCVQNRVAALRTSVADRLALAFRGAVMRKYERSFRKALLPSGLCSDKMEDVDHIMRHSTHLVNPELTGEAILTVGAVLNEVVDHYCGAIAIGPFGCMPNRLAEAILTKEMNMEGKMSIGAKEIHRRLAEQGIQDLPFLAIESDGNLFPPIITAKLEAFLLQAERLDEKMKGGEEDGDMPGTAAAG